MRLAGWFMALTTAVICAFAGWTYAQASGDSDLSYAKARDAALSDGRQHIARLNSMDGEQVEEGLRRWREAVTGALKEELARTGKESAKVLEQEGTTTVGTVTDAALTELDDRAGTAKLIATVRVEVEPRTGEMTTDRKRYEASLSHTSDGWKLSSLNVVPVGEA